MPENAIFRGRRCLRVRIILDLGVQYLLKTVFQQKHFAYVAMGCNEVKWNVMSRI
jgi:hypothetical protein